MKTCPLLASLLVASLAVPPRAFAQQPAEPLPPPPPVQPVPYAPSQPVPYPSSAPDGTVSVDVPRVVVGTDVVYLKGGGMIRGTLIEAVPNDHATVNLATGQSAVIPWDRIQRIDRGGSPSSPAPSPPPPPPVAYSPYYSPVPTGPAGSATVHVEADSSAIVERREGRSWVFACRAPCDQELPLSGLYRISGPEIRSTPAFHLRAQPNEHIVLDVSTASKGGFAGGIVLTSVGGASVLVGGMVLMVVAMFDWANDADGLPRASGDGTATSVGVAMLLGGAAAVVVGVIVLTSNRHSNVDQNTAKADPGRPRNDAWLRLPPWQARDAHDDKAASGVPKAVGVPIFETTF